MLHISERKGHRRDIMVEMHAPVLAAGLRYGRQSSLKQTDQQFARVKEGNWVREKLKDRCSDCIIMLV